jgi:AraC family transcriptional activator of pobA
LCISNVCGSGADRVAGASRHIAIPRFTRSSGSSAAAAQSGWTTQRAISPTAQWPASRPEPCTGFASSLERKGVVVTIPDIVFDPIRLSVDRAQRLVRPLVLSCVGDAPPALTALAGEHRDRAPNRAEALRAHVALLLIWILRHAAHAQAGPQDSSAPPTAGGRLFSRFQGLLEGEYARLHTVDAYARALAVTAPHLSRVCRQARGRSASALIRERQMLEARRLLAYTQIRVAEIAYELGYSDPAYFSRVFATHTGLSPRAFRQGFTDRTAGDT